MEALSPSSSTVAPHLRLLQQAATAKEQIHHYAQNSSIRGYPAHRRGLYNPSLGNALRLNTEANLVTGISEPELLPHAKGFQQCSKAETHHFNLEMEVANVIPATMNLHHTGDFDGPSAATAAHHGQADLNVNRDDDDRIDSAPYISHFLDATTTASSVTNSTIVDVNPPDMGVSPTDSSHYDDESVEVASMLLSDAWSTIANYGPWNLFETKPSLRNYLNPNYRAIPNFIVPRYSTQDATAWAHLNQSWKNICPVGLMPDDLSCPARDRCPCQPTCWVAREHRTEDGRPCTMRHILTTCACMMPDQDWATCPRRLSGSEIEKKRHGNELERIQLFKELDAHIQWANWYRFLRALPGPVFYAIARWLRWPVGSW